MSAHHDQQETLSSKRLLGPATPANYCGNESVNQEPLTSPTSINPSPVPSDSENEDFDENAKTYGTEPGRYVVLIGLSLVNATNALLWMTFASIVTPAEQYYGITASQINSLNIIFAAMYSGLFWISGVVLPKTGLGWGLVICASLNVGTTLCRLSSVWFAPVYGEILASNILGGLCQCLILSAPPMLSNQWFSLEERNFATGIGVSAQIFGAALGALLPANIVTEASAEKFEILYWIQFGLSALGLIITLLAKKAPTLPPTAAAFKFDENITRRSFHHERLSQNRLTNPADNPSQNSLTSSSRKSTKSESPQKPTSKKYIKRALKEVLTTLKTIVTNKKYMLLLVLSGVSQGSIWALGTLLMQIVQPFNVAQTTIGWVGFSGQLAGGLTSVGIGGLLGVIKDYKPIMIILTTATAVSCMVFPVVAIIIGDEISSSVSTAVVAIMYIGISVVGIPQCTVLFELGVEATFPLSEEITSPLVMWTPSFFSLICVAFQGAILTENPTKEKALIVLFINLGLFFVAVIIASFIRPEYKRREFEQQHETKIKDSIPVVINA